MRVQLETVKGELNSLRSSVALMLGAVEEAGDDLLADKMKAPLQVTQLPGTVLLCADNGVGDVERAGLRLGGELAAQEAEAEGCRRKLADWLCENPTAFALHEVASSAFPFVSTFPC